MPARDVWVTIDGMHGEREMEPTRDDAPPGGLLLIRMLLYPHRREGAPRDSSGRPVSWPRSLSIQAPGAGWSAEAGREHVKVDPFWGQ